MENSVEIALERPLVEVPRVERVAPGQTVSAALEGLGLRPAFALIALINGRPSGLGTLLQPGDRVRLLPQISGGGFIPLSLGERG